MNEVTKRVIIAKREITAKHPTVTSDTLFAQSIGCTKQHLSGCTHGRNDFTIEQIINVHLKFGYSFDWLLLGKDEKKAQKFCA